MLVLVGVSWAAILGGLYWLGTRVRKHGLGGAFMATFEEIYHPAAHKPRIEIQAQQQRLVPLPSADDKPSPPVVVSDC